MKKILPMLVTCLLLDAASMVHGTQQVPPDYSGDVNGLFRRDVNGHSGHVNKVGAQRRWDCNHIWGL